MPRKTPRPPDPGRNRGGRDASSDGDAASIGNPSTDSDWDDIIPESISPAITGDERARVWWAIIYPGEPSCPSWSAALERLRALHVPMAISPEHHDMDPATGELKKMHRHVLLSYSGKKSFSQVSADISPIGCVRIEPVRDIRAAVRYLCHLDEPDFSVSGKHRYDPADIIALSGFDLEKYIAPTTADRRAALRDMRQWCRTERVLDFAALMDHCDKDQPDWSDLIDSDSHALRSMEAYVRGLYHQYIRSA